MPAVASVDFETRSTCDLRKAGADVYAEHPTTQVVCMAWCIGDGPVEVWERGGPDPVQLLDHIRGGGIVTAWNSYFEESIWRHVVARDMPHWPQLKTAQLVDTMAAAYALALPGSLEWCGKALKLEIEKDKEGHRLMLRMCAPTLAWKRHKSGPPQWYEDRDSLDRLKAYCKKDVEVEREIAKRIAPLTKSERRIWLLDQKINRRGLHLDIANIDRAMAIAKDETQRLNEAMRQTTNAAVNAVSAPGQLKKWLETEWGITTPDMRKNTVAALTTEYSELDAIRPAVELRREGGKASTKKLNAMKACVNSDNRARGLLGYHVATTGRWAGRRVQPQNLFRPTLSDSEIADVFALFGEENAGDLIRFGYCPPIDAIASCLRGMITPAPGNVFMGGDFSSIEGRVIAWLAGEQWKLDAYRDYDAKLGPDLYIVAAADLLGVSFSEITKLIRQKIGKPQELALGYQGGPMALLNFCDPADIPVIAKAAIRAAGDEWEDFWTERMRDPRTPQQFGAAREKLDFDQWAAFKYVVMKWREKNFAIKSFWYDLESCAIEAVDNPQQVCITKTRSIKFVSTGAMLYCQLPSRRCLAYPTPKVIREVDEVEQQIAWQQGREYRPKPSLEFWAWDGIKKRWDTARTYGGSLAENVTQATARDLLADAMFRAEEAGYPIVLHVHDELLSEVPEGFGSPEEYQRIMCASAPWAKGLPVAAETQTSRRYSK